MQGVCIDTGLSAILRKDSTYFLREHGKNNYYVGNFDNPKSHFGSFQKKHFRLIAEPQSSCRRFVARVSSRYGWYTLGDEYIITEKDHNGYIHVYLKGKPHKGPIGSYLNSFFEIIAPFNEAETAKSLQKPEKLSKKKMGQPGIVITHIAIKRAKPIKEKPEKLTKAEKLEESGQLNLFDFMDS